MKRLFLITFFFAVASASFAQLFYKGEFGVTLDAGITSVNKNLIENVGLTVQGHLEADYDLDPVSFRVVLDPSIRVTLPSPLIPDDDGFTFEAGLTEAFVLWREGDIDVSTGVERLPLETSRLSIPFSIEPTGDNGLPQGLLGARVTWFTSNWRVRPVAFYKFLDEQAGGVLSVRRDFTDFELEAHALYDDGFALGLTGSGLLSEIVVYGEAWLVDIFNLAGKVTSLDGRGSLGISGFLGDSLWTVEATYTSNRLVPNAQALPQLLGQYNLPQGDSGSWDFTAGLGLDNSQNVLGLANASFTFLEDDMELTASAGLAHTSQATVYSLRVGVKGFF